MKFLKFVLVLIMIAAVFYGVDYCLEVMSSKHNYFWLGAIGVIAIIWVFILTLNALYKDFFNSPWNFK